MGILLKPYQQIYWLEHACVYSLCFNMCNIRIITETLIEILIKLAVKHQVLCSRTLRGVEYFN